jgi:hypothetical protein
VPLLILFYCISSISNLSLHGILSGIGSEVVRSQLSRVERGALKVPYIRPKLFIYLYGLLDIARGSHITLYKCHKQEKRVLR